MADIRGRVRAGVTGFHPGLQVELAPGAEHVIPEHVWSDALFERIEVKSAPSGPRFRPGMGEGKE